MRQPTNDEFVGLHRMVMRNTSAIEKSTVLKVDKVWEIMSRVTIDRRPQHTAASSKEALDDTIFEEEEVTEGLEDLASAPVLTDSTDTINELIRDYFDQVIDFEKEQTATVSEEKLMSVSSSAFHFHFGLLFFNAIFLQNRKTLAADIRVFVNRFADQVSSGELLLLSSTTTTRAIPSTFFLLFHFSGRCVARIFHGLQSPRYPALDWYKSNFWGRYTTVDFYVIKNMATKSLIELKTKKSQVQ